MRLADRCGCVVNDAMLIRVLVMLVTLAAPLAAQEVTGFDIPLSADVVILGEVHDNADHHLFQAHAIGVMTPSAVVFEMLSADQAARITPALLRDHEALEAALAWAQGGWPDFDIYAPVFAALGSAEIYGAALPPAEVRASVTEGAVAYFRGDAARFGLTEPLPPEEQVAREAGQMAAHCDALPPDLLPGMVTAQRLRDAELARQVILAHDATGGPVAVITGNGHARFDWGVPRVLARAAPGLAVLSFGQLEDRPEGVPPFDLWRITAPVARPDPCAAFR